VIDLHCHLLPGIDDGSGSLAESVEMARLAVADCISVAACTPHILPGVYDSSGPAIRAGIAALQRKLDEAEVPLLLVCGADVHMAPNLLEGLRDRSIPSLGDSRYFLLEPPHGILPPRFDDCLFGLVSAGYVPVITHPERLGWIETHYFVIEQAVRIGAWMQLTAGSIVGRFGKRARYWSERMLEEGLAHIIASDAHNTDHRPPVMSGAFEVAAGFVGREEAVHLVATRPAGILKNLSPSEMPEPQRSAASDDPGMRFWRRAARHVGM
jgi:protein-tyrosine phosphatase